MVNNFCSHNKSAKLIFQTHFLFMLVFLSKSDMLKRIVMENFITDSPFYKLQMQAYSKIILSHIFDPP